MRAGLFECISYLLLLTGRLARVPAYILEDLCLQASNFRLFLHISSRGNREEGRGCEFFQERGERTVVSRQFSVPATSWHHSPRQLSSFLRRFTVTKCGERGEEMSWE